MVAAGIVHCSIFVFFQSRPFPRLGHHQRPFACDVAGQRPIHHVIWVQGAAFGSEHVPSLESEAFPGAV